MPRIRKKTSNRGSTNERKKILHKVRESRRKTKKAAKKSPQWKSKTPKDPGIPNNFPFKDQVLAEVSAQRRIDAEEKLRRKEERKVLRAKVKNPTAEDESEEEEEEDEEDEVVEESGLQLEELKGLQIGNAGVGAIGARRLLNAKTFSRPAPAPVQEEEDEEEVPVLINRDLPNLQAVLDAADVIIQVLDARDPLSFRSSHLEELSAGKPGRRTLLVLNKTDTCPRESIAAWAAHLRTQHPTFLFRSATAFLPTIPDSSAKVKGKGKAKARADDGLGVDSVLACLGEWAGEKTDDQPLAVAVLGVTNAGKSSFINSLLRNNALPVYTVETSSRGPTTTELPQEVLVESCGKGIRLIDTPGLSWEVDEEAENRDHIRARDILLRGKGRIDRLKDPTLAVANIVTRSNTEDLMLFYSLPAFAKGDPTSFLSGVARSNQLIKKRGDLDLIGASRILLRDWSTGKFARYTTPPKPSTTSKAQDTDDALKKIYEANDAILETLLSRKEMRKSKGLVKLVSGAIESRKAVLEGPWLKEENAHGDEDADAESDEEDEMEVDGSADDEQEDEDEGVEEVDVEEEADEEAEEAPPPPTSKKQKRKRTNEPPVARPSKKVMFAPDPKTSKQARKAGSFKGNPQAKGKTTKTVTLGAGNDEAYDFGKFF